VKLSLLLICAFAGIARAQDATPTPTPAPTEVGAPPPQWVEWSISGRLIPGDTMESVRGVLEETMATHRALTQSAFEEIAEACGKIGYHLVRLDTPPAEGGVKAVLVLDGNPMVRSVDVTVASTFWSKLTEPPFEDEIKRRLRLRPGAYLEYDTVDRQRQLDEEQARVEDYLHDEGYFDARAKIILRHDADATTPWLRATVQVALGTKYVTGQVKVTGVGAQSPVSEAEVIAAFTHEGRFCVPRFGCAIDPRFTRAQHDADRAEVTKLFQSRGFHAVKVSTDFDPATSFDRRTHTVSFAVHVSERRQTDTSFKGNSVDESTLRAQLTFDEAGSADDYELAASALAIQRFYQSRGHFDAQITYKRESSQLVDHVTFYIDEGPTRELRGISFARVDGDGALAFKDSELEAQVSLKTTSFFGGGGYVSPTAQTLADDAERVRRMYVQAGYGDARVAVRVGPDPDHLSSPAVLGALLANDPSGAGLYIRFDIEQGPRTLLDAVEVAYDGPHRGTCAAALAQLADGVGVSDLADRAKGGCRVDLTALSIPTRPDALEAAGAKLKDWFWSLGRPRAEATLVVKAAQNDPHHSLAIYTVAEHADVKIGKVIVRGNFRTRTPVILDVLGFKEGAPLTGDLYAAGPRRLRETNLFSAVNVELLGFEENERDVVDVVVRVEERKDVAVQVDLEVGYTQINGDYAKGTATVPNFLGRGISGSLALTFPLHWVPPLVFYLPADAKFESIDADIKIPRWMLRNWIRLPVDNDSQAFIRQQDTPRFGQLQTIGLTDALSRVWQRPRSDRAPARSIAATLRYDYRFRSRDQDAIRASGPLSDASQVPVTTSTGSVGLTFVYDRRLDARGNLNPLIPDHGFRVEAGGSFATRYLGGGDDFFKINGSLQVIHTVNDRLQFHLDAKLDEGFPLGGAVLLPEVERFFAGGDTTVRGYAEDRVATEIIETGVPPFGGVKQIRVLPAGGNIRTLVSVDMQVRVWRVFGIPAASGIFCDAGLVTNTWGAARPADIRPSIGVSLFRLLAPFGAFSIDYAVPLAPRLGDNPLGFWAISVALR